MSVINALLVLTLSLSFANSQFPTFPEYVIAFNKTYNESEYAVRKNNYQNRIKELLTITDYTPGVNQRSDWTQQEINATRTLQVIPSTGKVASQFKLGSAKLGAAQSLDWRLKNAVTSIKNQKSCGCCWAFATVGYAESKLIIQGKYTSSNIDLSEQYMLQCTKYSNCDGGYLQYAIEQVKTLPTEEQYPYSPYYSYPGICYSSGITTGYISQMYYSLTDAQLIQLLQVGPVAISISSVGWINYGSGVFKCKPSDQVDHAVLLVGYTPTQWIVKNQWGTNWGQSGYIRITRTSTNNCKIGTSAAILSEIKTYTLLLFAMLLLFAIFL